MDLISYNVNGFPWNTVPIKQIVARIVENGNIVALQEVWMNHGVWSAAFAAYGWVFLRPAREQHVASLFGSGLAFAWCPKAWRAQEARFYPFLAHSGLDIFLARGWFQAEFVASTGRTVRIVNTRLQTDLDILKPLTQRFSDVARSQQARQLVGALDRQPRRQTLIVGDGPHQYRLVPSR
jgi:hypothetical protein